MGCVKFESPCVARVTHLRHILLLRTSASKKHGVVTVVQRYISSRHDTRQHN